jgi:hypothetical protein
MKFLKFAVAIALLPLLAACAAGPNTDATMKMANKGSAFHKALQAEYVALAVAEAEEWDTQHAPRPAQQSAHPRHQFFHREWLEHVIIGAGI